MTTEQDHGDSSVIMLRCELQPSNLYPTLVLALRDMRDANGLPVPPGMGRLWPALPGLASGVGSRPRRTTYIIRTEQ